jgi:hypothetical protein
VRGFPNIHLKPIILSFLIISGLLIISALTLQSWFDYEVQKQLDATEADINEITVREIDYYSTSVNLTVNTSFSNPYDLKITVLETNFSIRYSNTQFRIINAQLGVITLPEMKLSRNSSFLIINTTFHISLSQWWAYLIFVGDILGDGEALVNISGQLFLKAPALFVTVRSTNQIEKEIELTLDLFTLTKFDY